MRVKPVPVPPSAVDRLLDIRDALPLVPEPEESCCERLVSRANVEDAETARDWLTFLRGLGLAAEGSSGYYRTREEPDDSETPPASRAAGASGSDDVTERSSVSSQPESGNVTERSSTGRRIPSGDLDRALIEGVYGAREVYAILEGAEDPLTADEVFERFEAVPRWERRRNPDWEGVWRERVGRLLGWLTLIGRAERVEGGYRAA
ncbi:hypothetical protein [Halalkalicoccus salilacus]|uniref:hypothetical protein n=1 Tax=Halalkalicoccus salilacus TaxID=3117459 RepID=UPI00300EE362